LRMGRDAIAGAVASSICLERVQYYVTRRRLSNTIARSAQVAEKEMRQWPIGP
jgi:hypothetical protein